MMKEVIVQDFTEEMKMLKKCCIQTDVGVKLNFDKETARLILGDDFGMKNFR
jgi:hypothetical protein